MSIGVAALLFYIPLLFVLTLLVFRDFTDIEVSKTALNYSSFRVVLDWVVMILAVVICAYTGFLISALIRFPLINTAVLRPCSSLRAFPWYAAETILCTICFGGVTPPYAITVADTDHLVEAMCIFAITSLFDLARKWPKIAFSAFLTGVWAPDGYWLGAIFVRA